MLTEEQIKNLKKGDTVIYQGKFIGITNMNQIAISDTPSKPYFCVDRDRIGLSIPLDKPKYDPCRLFKKGDRVREVRCRGRRYMEDSSESLLTEGGVVAHDEDELHYIEIITPDGTLHPFDPAYLELVTPVKERIPYAIDSTNTNRILQYGQKFAEFEDYDAARACCNMLNDEWRKKHQNEGARLNAENGKEEA